MTEQKKSRNKTSFFYTFYGGRGRSRTTQKTKRERKKRSEHDASTQNKRQKGV